METEYWKNAQIRHKDFFITDNHGKLFASLSKAQGAMEGVGKTADNSFYNSKFSTLHDVGQAVKKPLADNGLFFSQLWHMGESPTHIKVRTIIGHESGEMMWSVSSIWASDATSHKLASALTYARRHSLVSTLGVTSQDLDDDGCASLPPSDKELLTKLKKASKGGGKSLTSAWKDLSQEERSQIHPEDRTKLKNAAKKADAKTDR